MSEEILINVTPRETRIALVENGVLQEVHIERSNKTGLVGNIYKGRVSRVLPGMQAAFVDIGLERAAFLHVSDIVPLVDEPTDNPLDKKPPPENIAQLVREGQPIMVQVVKDPLGTKGARLTTHISIPSRFMVFMPDSNHIGISQRIESEEERERLKTLVEIICKEHEQKEGGYIVRTAAESALQKDLAADIQYLNKLWRHIQQRYQSAPIKSVVYEELTLVMRTMRDMVSDSIEKIKIDSRESYQKVIEFVDEFIPEIKDAVEYYPGERPIFDLYGVEDEIQKALERKVELKSGGYLIIDQTEAMTTVDINTGAFVGSRNLEETIFKTNLEAASAVARQLRLRNLGGIIIIDFIDMEDEDHKRQVLRTLEKALEKDHAKTHVSEVSILGLVEMTRKRTRESLEHILCEPCPHCHQRGTVKTPDTVCYEIFREIIRSARAYDPQKFLILASQQVIDALMDEEAASLAELEMFINKPITFQVESLYTQEQYDVVLI